MSILVVDFDQSWVESWQAGVPPTDSDALVWIRSRPAVIKELMLRFPPSCLVKATRPLACPHPGTLGIVTSLLEDGNVSVRQEPHGTVRAECEPEWLEVVGYHRGMTPQWVSEVLGARPANEVR